MSLVKTATNFSVTAFLTDTDCHVLPTTIRAQQGSPTEHVADVGVRKDDELAIELTVEGAYREVVLDFYVDGTLRRSITYGPRFGTVLDIRRRIEQQRQQRQQEQQQQQQQQQGRLDRTEGDGDAGSDDSGEIHADRTSNWALVSNVWSTASGVGRWARMIARPVDEDRDVELPDGRGGAEEGLGTIEMVVSVARGDAGIGQSRLLGTGLKTFVHDREGPRRKWRSVGRVPEVKVGIEEHERIHDRVMLEADRTLHQQRPGLAPWAVFRWQLSWDRRNGDGTRNDNRRTT